MLKIGHKILIFVDVLIERERISFPFLIAEFGINMISKIEALLNERFSEEDMQDCFTLEVKLEKSKRLTIFIDSDEGINYKKCARVSRFLEAAIEENAWLPTDYTIDVSSPGADKPLIHPRQYAKHMGRDLEILKTDGERLEGELKNATESNITIETKKKEAIEVPFVDMKETKVKLKFK